MADLTFFRRELLAHGVNATIKTYLPSLIDGIFGKLYHGLQTLGWGYVETGVTDMAAQGLAWMATGYQPPAPLATKPTATNLTEVLTAMHADSRLPTFSGDPTFLYYGFLAELVANFSSVLQEYDLKVEDGVTLEESLALAVDMSDATFRLFAAANFSSYTNVHHIASVHATTRVLQYLGAAERAKLLRRQWQAIVYNVGTNPRDPKHTALVIHPSTRHLLKAPCSLRGVLLITACCSQPSRTGIRWRCPRSPQRAHGRRLFKAPSRRAMFTYMESYGRLNPRPSWHTDACHYDCYMYSQRAESSA